MDRKERPIVIILFRRSHSSIYSLGTNFRRGEDQKVGSIQETTLSYYLMMMSKLRKLNLIYDGIKLKLLTTTRSLRSVLIISSNTITV